MDTKTLANRLAARYLTRNPFDIAENKNFIILRVPLVEVRGFSQYIKRCGVIYINEALDEQQQKIVCAHELGHLVMHKDCNRIFMDTRTFIKTSPFETEAHHFAVDLIYDDSDMRTYLEYEPDTVARCLGISREQAEYRLSTVEPMLW